MALRRKMPTALTATTAALGVLAFSPATASADANDPNTWTLKYTTAATTTVKKMGTPTSTTGTITSKYNLTTTALTSNIALKDFKTPVKMSGMQLGYATIAQEPVGPATGKVDSSTGMITQKQKVYLHIKDISPLGKGLINYVGPNCRTSVPVEMTVTGKMNGLFDPITLTGTYEIPKFSNCGLMTDLVTKQVSGPGNTITLKLTPSA